MKCKCCHHELQMDEAFCPLCRFPSIKGVDDVNEEVVRRMVREYTENKLRSIRLDLRTYEYVLENGALVERDSQYITLCRGKELRLNEPIWCGVIFEKIPSDRAFTVSLNLRSEVGEKSIELPVTPDHVIEHGKIGVSLGEEFTLQVFLMSGDEKICIGKIPVLKNTGP